MFEQFFAWYLSLGLGDITAVILARASSIVIAILLSVLLYWLSRRLILRVLARSVSLTNTEWDDILLRSDIFTRLSYLAPAIVLYLMAPLMFEGYPNLINVVNTVVYIYAVVVGASIALALLEGLLGIYSTFDQARQVPLRSSVQVLKIVVIFIAMLAVVSTVLNQSATVLLSGLGAFTAVIMLIFRDPILGFAAGVQLTAHKMVAIGDFIEMPRYNAAGEVLDIALTTIKVRNADQSITTIPTYSLISESFKNWRGRDETGVRRLQRAIRIDLNTVRWCDEAMLENFANIQYLSEYIASKQTEIAAYNEDNGILEESPVNGRRLTNIGTFRAYVEIYLQHHPYIDQNRTLIVRQLPPAPDGLPIEIYAFCTIIAWRQFEAIQADIFDHLVAVLPEFGLRAYQNPTVHDFRVNE
ncbi:MAG: mechanosensitive ion channel domain-containing protein [Chloroflexota bacterium]